MSIAEHQLSLKNLIDTTTDETVLKRWKSLLEADLEQRSATIPGEQQNTEAIALEQEAKRYRKYDASQYVVIESGLGIDE